jgi:hypothetical protein
LTKEELEKNLYYNNREDCKYWRELYLKDEILEKDLQLIESITQKKITEVLG